MFDLGLFLAQTTPSGPIYWIDRLARSQLSTIVMFSAACTVVRLALWPTLKGTAPHLRSGFYSFAKVVSEVMDALVYAAILVFMIVRPFFIQTFYIPSGSMIDTLLVNDYIVANKMAYRVGQPQHGDIVVFKPPKGALYPGQEDTDFIKRLIGKPGDVIELKEKKLYRNGEPLDEKYVDYTDGPEGRVLPPQTWSSVALPDFKIIKDGDRYIPLQYVGDFANTPNTITHCATEFAAPDEETMRRWIASPAVAIPDGHFLFMGDNRNGSFDGRGWGLVPRDWVIGKAEFVFFPLSRMKWAR